MSAVTDRLNQLGIVLPRPAAPVANYVPFVRSGALVFISGQLPFGPDGKLSPDHIGKLGPDTPTAAAEAAARLCAINLIAQARDAVGDLERIARVVRLGGFFNVVSSFDHLPKVMNGASDLMTAVFGDKGRHARTTVGVAHLPMNVLAEIEATFEVAQ